MISVVIPTYNEERNIVKCLKSLNNQSIPRKDYEIIVVDGHSNDKTIQLAKKYADKIIMQKSKGVGGARNDGVAIAKGDIIATTDADCVVFENWLEETTDALVRKNNVMVFGKLIAMKNKKVRYIHRLYIHLLNIGMEFTNKLNIVNLICAANLVFRKKPFLKIGGFSNDLVSDDFEIGLRMKKQGKVRFCKKMKVIYNLRRFEKCGLFNVIGALILSNSRLILGFDTKINYAKQNYDE